MSNIFKTSQYAINIENVTHAHISNDAVVLIPGGRYTVRLVDEDIKRAVDALKAAGFVGDDYLLVNPRRFLQAQNSGATANMYFEGLTRPIVVPAEFLLCLDPKPEPAPIPVVSNAGKSKKAKSEE